MGRNVFWTSMSAPILDIISSAPSCRNHCHWRMRSALSDAAVLGSPTIPSYRQFTLHSDPLKSELMSMWWLSPMFISVCRLILFFTRGTLCLARRVAYERNWQVSSSRWINKNNAFKIIIHGMDWEISLLDIS